MKHPVLPFPCNRNYVFSIYYIIIKTTALEKKSILQKRKNTLHPKAQSAPPLFPKNEEMLMRDEEEIIFHTVRLPKSRRAAVVLGLHDELFQCETGG